MYEGSPVTFSFRALRESDTLQAGSARLQVLHMPGHTPQSLSLLVTAERRDYERIAKRYRKARPACCWMCAPMLNGRAVMCRVQGMFPWRTF